MACFPKLSLSKNKKKLFVFQINVCPSSGSTQRIPLMDGQTIGIWNSSEILFCKKTSDTRCTKEKGRKSLAELHWWLLIFKTNRENNFFSPNPSKVHVHIPSHFFYTVRSPTSNILTKTSTPTRHSR